MSIVQRAKNIIVKPTDEWNVIASEPATISGLFTGYAMPLALIPLVATILFTGLLGISAADMMGLGSGMPLDLMTYAGTPTGVVALVSWIPFLGAVVGFAAIVYVIYLIYLGLNPILGVPKEKIAGFTVVIVLVYVVLALIMSGIVAALLYATFSGDPMMGGGMSGA